MEKQNKICQSCGMPMKKDSLGGGTNSDGSKSLKYCSHCYTNGSFNNPDIDSAEKMQQLVMGKMKEMGFPRFMGRFFTKNIPSLERWKA